mmetsp:Transcript_21475/g.26307  ORF Transcript_21475/g.26307 Transcript_21475/m.26307 type:complete len:81 (+) Transcript_21475:165-407(+)
MHKDRASLKEAPTGKNIRLERFVSSFEATGADLSSRSVWPHFWLPTDSDAPPPHCVTCKLSGGISSDAQRLHYRAVSIKP